MASPCCGVGFDYLFDPSRPPEAPDSLVNAGRVHPYEHLVVADHGLVDLCARSAATSRTCTSTAGGARAALAARQGGLRCKR
jgi:hypothetical protein